MPFAFQVVVLLHLVGFAALLGGAVVQLRSAAPDVNRSMLFGAWAQLVTGATLVVLAEIGPDPVNHLKLTLKILIALAVLVLVAMNRKYASIPRGLLALIGGLTFAAAAVAVLWQ